MPPTKNKVLKGYGAQPPVTKPSNFKAQVNAIKRSMSSKKC